MVFKILFKDHFALSMLLMWITSDLVFFAKAVVQWVGRLRERRQLFHKFNQNFEMFGTKWFMAFQCMQRILLQSDSHVVSTTMGPFNSGLAKYKLSKIIQHDNLDCLQNSLFSFNKPPFSWEWLDLVINRCKVDGNLGTPVTNL